MWLVFAKNATNLVYFSDNLLNVWAIFPPSYKSLDQVQISTYIVGYFGQNSDFDCFQEIFGYFQGDNLVPLERWLALLVLSSVFANCFDHVDVNGKKIVVTGIYMVITACETKKRTERRDKAAFQCRNVISFRSQGRSRARARLSLFRESLYPSQKAFLISFDV